MLSPLLNTFSHTLGQRDTFFISSHLLLSWPSKAAAPFSVMDSLVIIGPRYIWGPISGSLCHSIQDLYWDLIGVTLAGVDTNSKPTESINRVIQGNAATPQPILELMQVAPSNSKLVHMVPFGGQIYNWCKWRHLAVKFATNVSGAIRLPNSAMQVAPSDF